MDKKATIKKPVLIACLAVLAVTVAGGAAFYLVSANEERQKEQAVEERQQEVLDDLYYANRYNFACYTGSGQSMSLSLISEAKDDPTRYARVDFYDERPSGFGLEEVEDGVVVAFPSGRTKASLKELNSAIGEYGIDASAFGLGQEVTMHDMVTRRAEVQTLVDEIDPSTKESIYNPEIDIMPSLVYTSDFNFALYTRSGEFDGPGMIDEVLDNPADYDRVDYYDTLPGGLDLEDIEDGVVIAVPTEKTQKSLDRLNDLLKQYSIDTTSLRLGPEVTVYDAVHRPGAIQILFDRIQGATPEETAALRDSIRNPE